MGLAIVSLDVFLTDRMVGLHGWLRALAGLELLEGGEGWAVELERQYQCPFPTICVLQCYSLAVGWSSRC
jgi:hypothetical protein